MTQYPGYEIERFEDEGGSFCYLAFKSDPEPNDREEIPVIDFLGDDFDDGDTEQRRVF